MAGNISIKTKISGSGHVGVAPASALSNALRWAANRSPAVQEIDAAIADVRAKREAAVAAFDAQVAGLKAQREAAVQEAVRGMGA